MQINTLVKRLVTLALISLGVGSVTVLTHASCSPAPTLGDDNIVCTGNNPALVLYGDIEIGDGSGDDTIINNGMVEAIIGDNLIGEATGDDTLTNNGTVIFLIGDSRLGTGSGDDTLTNNGTVFFLIGDSEYWDGLGDDTIINNGTVIFLIGDSTYGDGSGNDTIINNGMVSLLFGDSSGGNQSGDDTIINNDTITVIVGDNFDGTGFGNDTIINNGTVNDIIGDSYIGNGSGNDTIINNGVVMNIYGDSFDRAGSGNDTIINNGSVSGDIIAGGGNDYIVIRGSVGGLIDGGDGIDILDFGLAGCAGVLQGDIIGEVIASADENPAGGTITIGANTYTWANFEELLAIVEIFFCDGRNEIHDFATPTVSYCNSLGGFDVYDVNVLGADGRSTEGILTMRVDGATMLTALETAMTTGQNQLIAEDAYGNQLWALSSNEIQLMGPEVNNPATSYVTILPASTCSIN